jgi:thioredoxin 1
MLREAIYEYYRTGHSRDDFDREVLHETMPVAVEFRADWAAESEPLAHTLEAVAAEFKDEVHVATIDVDELPDLRDQWQVDDVPTVIMFHGGRAIKKWNQPQDVHEYRQNFESRLRQMNRRGRI